MNYNKDKVDDVTLALLYLGTWSQKNLPPRAWKSYDWETMNRLHEKGFIGDPKSKAKSVVMTDEGFDRAHRLFEEMFGLVSREMNEEERRHTKIQESVRVFDAAGNHGGDR